MNPHGPYFRLWVGPKAPIWFTEKVMMSTLSERKSQLVQDVYDRIGIEPGGVRPLKDMQNAVDLLYSIGTLNPFTELSKVQVLKSVPLPSWECLSAYLQISSTLKYTVLFSQGRATSLEILKEITTAYNSGNTQSVPDDLYGIVTMLLQLDFGQEHWKLFALKQALYAQNHKLVQMLVTNKPKSVCKIQGFISCISQGFMTALVRNDIKTIKIIVKGGYVDPNRNHCEALQYTAIHGHTECFTYLLSIQGVDPGANQNTSLFGAITIGNARIVTMLLSCPGLNPNLEQFVGGLSPLVQTILQREIPLVQLFLTDPRVDPAINDNEPIKTACALREFDIVERLLQFPSVDPSVAQNCVLSSASQCNQYNIVHMLLQRNETQPGAYDNKALRNAVQNQHVSIVVALLEDTRIWSEPNILLHLKYCFIVCSQQRLDHIMDTIIDKLQVDPILFMRWAQDLKLTRFIKQIHVKVSAETIS